MQHRAPGLRYLPRKSTAPKKVCANVDLFSGLIYRMLGISEDLFTPLFAIARKNSAGVPTAWKRWSSPTASSALRTSNVAQPLITCRCER